MKDVESGLKVSLKPAFVKYLSSYFFYDNFVFSTMLKRVPQIQHTHFSPVQLHSMDQPEQRLCDVYV